MRDSEEIRSRTIFLAIQWEGEAERFEREAEQHLRVMRQDGARLGHEMVLARARAGIYREHAAQLRRFILDEGA